jgi:hypothetical protein
VTYENGAMNSIKPQFYYVDDFCCRLRTTTAGRTYRLKGRFLALLGISVIDEDAYVEFSNDNPLEVQLPFHGHEQIMVHTSLSQKNLCNIQEEERIMDSDLLQSIMVDRTEFVGYERQHDGCKLPLSDSNIDVFTIDIRDKWGNLMPSLKNYVIVLGIDFFPVGSDGDSSVSLFDVRKRLRYGGYYSMK